MRIVAVVCSYYPQRVVNVRRIIKDLDGGTMKPDEVIVLNNNLEYRFPQLPGISVVDSWNSWTRGKYGAAVMCPSEYYLLLDDDVTVKERTLECFARYAHHECCIGGEGRILDEDGLYNGPASRKVWPEEVEVETSVDALVGQVQFLSMTAIARMFDLERRVRHEGGEKFLYEAEDILIGLANPTTIVPMAKEDESPTYLDERGVCLPQIVKDYGAMRERFTKKTLAILREGLRNGEYPELMGAPWVRREGL